MNRLLPVFLLICLLWICFSCQEPFPELPEETQTGAQTFGCLVNDELVFARDGSYYYSVGHTNAVYYIETDRLVITATCQFDQQFIFYIDHPQQKAELQLNQIRYLLPNSTDWVETEDTGRIYLTRFDMSGYESIVSGTFSFELSETNGKLIKITKGRFDLKMAKDEYQYFE
ncbi:MAG: hypothetical protein FWD60_10440 [Candidatus Azobacteroides sp.]|nr:hypothetical protein [Candidatus Azobacteroides sp.]